MTQKLDGEGISALHHGRRDQKRDEGRSGAERRPLAESPQRAAPAFAAIAALPSLPLQLHASPFAVQARLRRPYAMLQAHAWPESRQSPVSVLCSFLGVSRTR